VDKEHKLLVGLKVLRERGSEEALGVDLGGLYSGELAGGAADDEQSREYGKSGSKDSTHTCAE